MPAVLVPMNTPIRFLPQRLTDSCTACSNPSWRRPISARRLLRQSKRLRSAGNAAVSMPGTSPTCVSRSTVSNAHLLRPLRCPTKESSVCSRPRPMQLVAVNFLSSSGLIAVCRSWQRRAQRDWLQLPIAQRLEQTWQDIEDHRRPAASARRVAIVQQQNIAASQGFHQAPIDRVGIAADGIETSLRPGPEPQLQATQYGFEKGIAQARGCAEKARA